jgi:hypothetical protein
LVGGCDTALGEGCALEVICDRLCDHDILCQSHLRYNPALVLQLQAESSEVCWISVPCRQKQKG